MSTKIKRARLLITLLVTLFLIGGTVIAIQLAKGYRPNIKQLSLSGTGLLSATSYPKNAQVYINDRLTTVTDDTLNLSPGEYQFKIIKTGFHPWTKTLPINSELVSITDARLFPSIPSITPITFYQVDRRPLISPDGSKLLYLLTGSPFSQDNGLYVFSLANNFLAGNQITQIADLSAHDYSQARLVWSPDNSQVLAVFADNQKVTSSHLLNSRSMNQSRNLTDITFRLPLLLGQWQEQLASINHNNLIRLPSFMAEVATQSAVNVYFSPDREKLLFTATKDLEIPLNLSDRTIPSINPAPQQRNLSAGKTYVYDIKEDSNYLIDQAKYNPQTAQPLIIDGVTPISQPTPTPAKGKVPNEKPSELSVLLAQIDLLRASSDPHTTQNILWYSTNRHLIVTDDSGVSIIEYDGNNLTPIISAQIAAGFAIASPDGSHLIILSNMNQKPDIYNLISLDLK